MNFASISDTILTGWLINTLDLSQNNIVSLIQLYKLSDSDKTASMTTYLNARISNNNSEASSLPGSVQSQVDALNADTAACNTLLGN